MFRLRRGDSERSGGFGSGLRHHEHAHSSIGEAREDAAIDTHYPHHGHTTHGDECGLVDGRNAADESLSRCCILANDSVATGGVERVAHEDGDTRLAHREDGGGIDDFSPEVAQFCRLIVGEFVDGESRGNDSWVGCHESINICPNLQHLSTECCSNDGSGVVRASTSEVGGVPSGDIARNETTNNGDLWQRVHVLLDGCMSGFKIYSLTRSFFARFDDFLCINVDGFVDGTCHDSRRKEFAVSHNGVGDARGKFLDKTDALKQAPQFAKAAIDQL